MKLPQKIENAVIQVARLPGVGEKTALRQVLSILGWQRNEILELAKALADLRDINHCEQCGVYWETNLCEICANPHRAQSGSLCVVENIKDFMAIERSGQFKGLYHVLGGVLNPLMGIGPDQLNIQTLLGRIKNKHIQEVILAINPSIEGDATCSYLRDKISENVKVERIGFGIPIGGSLEYLDQRTISKALEFRRAF